MKISKFRDNGLCQGNPPVTGGSPHKGPVTLKMFPFDGVIMWSQIWDRKTVSSHPCQWSLHYDGVNDYTTQYQRTLSRHAHDRKVTIVSYYSCYLIYFILVILSTWNEIIYVTYVCRYRYPQQHQVKHNIWNSDLIASYLFIIYICTYVCVRWFPVLLHHTYQTHMTNGTISVHGVSWLGTVSVHEQ